MSGFSNDASTLLTTADDLRKVSHKASQAPVMRAAALLGATMAQIAAAFIERHDADMVGREVELAHEDALGEVVDMLTQLRSEVDP